MSSLIENLAWFYLFLFSLYHVVTGIISIFFPNFSLKFYKVIYGIQPIETKQLLITFKPWGSFAFIMGVISFFVFFNINTYYNLLLTFIALLILRIWYRSVFYDSAKEFFKISFYHNLKMIIIQVIGVILFFYLWFIKF
ncbi:MAG: hypothetical protein Q7K54_04505 [Candidatus Parcubacteria bacterium]|nr:hypothetical protein [Candidatus Parcubacteria bacterium]